MAAIIRIPSRLTSLLIVMIMLNPCGWAQAPVAKSKLKIPPRPYEMIMQTVEVKPTRLDGTKWDPQDDSPPDLYVTISRNDPMLQQSLDALRTEYHRLTLLKQLLEQQAKGEPAL